MNERIKDFEQQAYEYAKEQCPNGTGFTRVYAEKFSELIVRACAKSIWDDAPFGAVKLIENMQERVGVVFDTETLRD